MIELKDTTATRLTVYMRGFRIAASGGYWNPSEMKNPDFKKGHADGVKAVRKAQTEAADWIALDQLRLEMTS